METMVSSMISGPSLELGRMKRGKKMYLDPKTRSTHMHVIGASGRGKSKFLEFLIRQDIEQRQGLCLIDPHGYLYHDIVRWCATHNLLKRRKIVLFDPSSDEWTFGFNPLDFGNDEVAFCVDAMVKACAQVWGGEDMTQTPLLKRCLRATFHALAEGSHTLLESLHLTTPSERVVRAYLTHGIQDHVFRSQWATFNTLNDRAFMEYFSSTNNRIIEFLAAKRIRSIIGQKERVINFRKLMDEGYILLVNLASGSALSDDNARLLGSLIVNDLFLKARGRPQKVAQDHPFYLYIDECALFINEDIGRILDEARKFGLHLILAHQHLAQLKKAGEAVYHSVMTNAQTKVVFGGLSPDDARVMAELVFMGEFDLEESKRAFDKPAVVRYIRNYLESEMKGISHSRGETVGESTGESVTHGDSRSRGGSSGGQDSRGSTTSRSRAERIADGEEIGGATITEGVTESANIGSSYSDTWQEAYSESRAENFSRSFAETNTEGSSEARTRAETLEPVIEWLPGQSYSLAEQVYKAMAVMINQTTQRAIVKIPNRHSMHIMTPNVTEGFSGVESVAKFKKEAFKRTDYAALIVDAEKEIDNRRAALEAQAQLYLQSLAGESEPSGRNRG
jgi:hypothetical protein